MVSILLTLHEPQKWQVANHQTVSKPRGAVAYVEFTGAISPALVEIDDTDYGENRNAEPDVTLTDALEAREVQEPADHEEMTEQQALLEGEGGDDDTLVESGRPQL